MADLGQRLRDAVDHASPIDLEEVQARPVVARRRRQHPAALAAAAAGGLVAAGLVIAVLVGVFATSPPTRLSVGGAASSVSTSATRDGVTVTITLAQRAVRAGEPVRGHITFDNRSGHPFRNSDACPDEGLNVTLVGHGVPNAVPSGAGCTHPYLLPSGTTVLGFSVPTTRSGPTGARRPDAAGRYRIETMLYPEGLPVPPPVSIVLTPATTSTSTSATATAHGISVRLTLDTSKVPLGGTVRGRLTVTTPKAIRGCPKDWYDVGLTSARTGSQLPGSDLPLCAKTAIPAGTSSYHFKQTADYQACTQSPTQATRDMPRCSGRGMPVLPSGLYQLTVEYFITGLPTPAPIPLTITSGP